ncbi:MAG: PEP/pyruvate-binding domain-containing protein [Kiritimatiellae bacterium]|nr:PEP/pyruvate-binding domain-containing protein [Kiritimatiellia bacterium]MDD4025316.1 PEP/pyruvate-binding domain-containing protein [Kiritimatiellia bacterium]
MSDKKQANDRFRVLRERAKELNCLYQVEELLASANRPMPDIFRDIVQTIPCGWQYPKLCQARIVCDGEVYEPTQYMQTPWTETVPIKVEGQPAGFVEVSYVSEVPTAGEGVFLQKERKLIRTIAERIGQTVFHRKLEKLLREWEAANRSLADDKHGREWMVILDLLRRTDEKLYLYTSRKMLYHLFWSGVKESRQVLNLFGTDFTLTQSDGTGDSNSPSQKQSRESILAVSDQVFTIAARHLSDNEILDCLHKWIKENKLSFLIKTVDSASTPFSAVLDAIMRYRSLASGEIALDQPTEKWLRVSLIRRFFADNIEFINLAKRHLEVSDFFELATHIIHPSGSNGHLGGKSTGLFLAWHILRRAAERDTALAGIKTPKTWYMTADCLTEFLRYNDLEDVNEQKYKDIEQIRIEYPNIIQLFKHARFPSEMAKGISMALDDFGDNPIIVRSSSLLEDRAGTAFSGKYKSLFLSNQGSKQERLENLLDAIAEIYASVFGSDPILYRAEHGLLDFHEEMGIMIQEVVGARVGPYLLPVFAGVAFSSNEFRWSPRLKRDDGLIRLVPGLGTRAVDRVSDDYPVLLSPGQPALRVNATADEVRHYSPAYVDLINMDSRCFETVQVSRLLRDYGQEMPQWDQLVSVYRDGNVCRPSKIETDLRSDELIVTFDGLITRTDFVKRMRAILLTLQDGLGTAVDIEFASDGSGFHLLQCRPQYTEKDVAPSAIPQDIQSGKLLFTANRFISNGRVPDISHIVYVSPEKYAEQGSVDALVDIGRAVSRLNALLPKRRFILMGPGRWGSRGDIKQGVQVTYSDICNTAVLIEIARKKGSYSPELSFGTHFFQDMVEAGIRYIPLYPDDVSVVFNERFLNSSHNILAGVLPEYEHLADVVKVIDVPGSENGDILRILMNADLGDAVGFVAEPAVTEEAPPVTAPMADTRVVEDFWRWRLRMAEQLARRMIPERFGVQALYLFGSTSNATAGPGSDIDLLVHFNGTPEQRQELMLWLEGWSLSLAEQNYLRTGYTSEGLLDVHVITDEDIARRTSYAVKIDAVTDPAWRLPLPGKDER